MSINEVERTILEQLSEDLDLPDNWDGTGLVRGLVSDAVDEVCVLTGSYHKTVTVALEASTPIYVVGSTEEPLIGIRSVFLVDHNRKLQQTDLLSLRRKDWRWMRTRGTPYLYVPLDFTKILVYPIEDDGGLTLSVDGVFAPPTYSTGDHRPDVWQEFDELIRKYVVAHVYLTIPGRLQDALEMYKDFIESLGGPRKLQSRLNSIIWWERRSQQEQAHYGHRE